MIAWRRKTSRLPLVASCGFQHCICAIILGTAENFSQTLQMAATLKPDVVLVDIHMPDSGSFEPAFVKSELAQSGARVLGMSLSSGEDDEEVRALAESLGVLKLLNKSDFGRVLIPAILQA